MSDVAVATVRRSAPARTPLFALTARRATRSGLLWGAIFGILVFSSAVSYTKIYTTGAERAALAKAVGANHATAALFGPAPELQTVAGFVVLKSLMTMLVLGALWGLLTSTRLLRGEEDAGRWDLLFCGRLTSRRATLQALAALGVALAALWFVTALFTIGTGHLHQVKIGAAPSLYFSLVPVAAAGMFLAVGALTSQLAANRRQAAALAGWFLGASYLARMVADAGVGVHGLIWATPLGWVEQLQPLTDPHPLALVPIVGFTVLTLGAATYLSGTRDVGGSVLPEHDSARARVRLLTGQFGLSARLLDSTAVAWLSATAITGFVLGLIAEQAGATISGSSVQEVFTKLGAPGSGATAFLGVSFIIAAILVAFIAAGQIMAARAEEAQGRLANLVVAPCSRDSWLIGRVLLALGLMISAGLVVGVAAWIGAAAESGGTALTTLVEAGLNVVPPAFCLLGIGVLALGTRPRWTSSVAYGVLGWSLLVELIGGFGSGSRWLLDTSLFHQMAAAPAVSPNWGTNASLCVVGAVCASLGLLGFRRRDLVGV